MAGIRAEVDLSLNTTQAQRSMQKAGDQLNKVMGGMSGKGVNFKINERSFTQPLGRITGSANEFTKSLEASNARVIAFGASVGILNGISNAFKNLVAETVKFEKTLADVNVVLNASNSSLEAFGSNLFDVAKNTAQSFNVAATAALEFSRQGLEMNEVLKRTNDALVLTRLTGLKAEEAVAGLTAAVNAFGDAGLTTTDIIDKLAAVDVKFAVSAEDLIKALERTGAVAIDAGVEIDSLIGMVAALQQTTARGGAVIGNGLKTIFTRIQRPESLKQLEKMDMLVKDLSGSVLSADKILLNIAKNFDNLTEAQQSNVVQFGAGIFQANIFRAAIRDLAKEQSLQVKATNISAEASGNASVKNEQLNKTIAAMASQSVSALQELAAVMGNLMVAPEIGSFLEFLKGGIEGLTDMLGGGEEHGSTFAKGLVRGIGNILTGPAAIAFGMVFVKLFVNIAKFARTSLKDVLGIVGQKDRIKQTEESIVKALSTNTDLQHGLNNLAGDHAAQEIFVLKMIEAQTNAMREQQRLAKRLAIPVLRAGVQPDLTVKGKSTTPVDLDGDGQTDSFGAKGVLPSSARKERKEASRGGYSAGAVDSMSIKGLGKVVYNKAETVKQFPGMQQPAIMPPRKSRAGSAYEEAFSQKHGFDPYASGGFIPNFADLFQIHDTKGWSSGGQPGRENGYYKTPLDVVEYGLKNTESLSAGKKSMKAGMTPGQVLAEEIQIAKYNIKDNILNSLLKGEYAGIQDTSFNNLLQNRIDGSSARRFVKSGTPMAKFHPEYGYYDIPSPKYRFHPGSGDTSAFKESIGLGGYGSVKRYDPKKFMSEIESARDFAGMAQDLVASGDASDDWMGKSLTQQKGLLSMRAQGLIPNFATISGDALRLNQSKMHLYANPREAKPGGDAVRNAMRELVNSGKPVTVRAPADKLYQGGGGSHTKAIKGLIKFIADQKNGPKLFERDFKLTNLPWKGNKGEDASEDAVAKLLNKDGKKYINTGKRPGAHGDKTFPVDLIGEGLDPVEVKSGEWKQPNILLKSMRLYSDDELIQFAERQYGATPEMLTGARMENLGKSARLLQGKGLLDKDASLEDQHKAAMKYRIAGGFVPNFAGGHGGDRRTGVLGANWEEALGSIKSWVAANGGTAPDMATLEAETGKSRRKFQAVARGHEGDSTFRAARGQLGLPKLKILQDYIAKASKGATKGENMTPADISIWASKVKLKDAGTSTPNLSGAEISAVFPGTVTGQGDAFAGPGLTPPEKLTGKDLTNFKQATFRGQIDKKGLGKNKTGAIADARKLLGKTITPGWKDWEDLLAQKGYLGNNPNFPKSPLDFTSPKGEAKWGAAEDKLIPAQIIGKLLRHQVGSGNFPGWNPKTSSAFKSPAQGAFNIGSVDLLSVPKAAQGLVPNFAGDTALYRGTSPKYQKGSPDTPNAPQFLFDKLLNAKTKIGFLSAAEELGIQHSQGQYSGSYNADLKPATLEQIRGPNVLGAGEVQHAGYVYKRPTKGGRPRYASDGTTMPSGFVSKTKNRDVADRFSRAIEFQHTSNHDLQGQIHEDQVPNSRILNEEALGKIVDRVGLGRVQKGFKRMMEKGTLKALYLDLDEWKPKTEEGERRRSYDDDHNYRSIGQSGEGMTFNEEEVVQIWDKHSPYYGAGKGLIPNFADNRNRKQKISDVLGDPSNAGINFEGGALKARSIKSKNMLQKMWLESYFKTGLEGDYQMLMKMGYDPDTLLNLRAHAKKGGEVNILGKGFIPNFNVQNGAQTLSGKNPLKEAISREAGAGIPRSQIKVEQSGQLRGPGNPMGLAVTNTRDEPLGVRQGINRARSMGIDPKTHGAGLGLIPNFADGGPKLKVTMLSAARLQEKKAILENAKALNESTSAIDKNRKKTDEDTKASSFGIEKLFFFQSAISGVNGFLEEFSEGASGVSKKLIGMTQAASDTTAAFIQSHTAATELLSMTGESERRIGLQDLGKKEGGFLSTISDARKGFTEGRAEGKGGGALGKLKSFGKGLAGAGKVLSRLAPIASQLYTGFTFANKAVGLFTANNETMTDLMSSGTKRAAKRLEELSTVTQEVTGSLEKLDAAEKNQEKIKELETKGTERTISEEKELMEVRKNQLKLGRTETDVLGRMAKLQNSGITAEKIAAEAFADLTRQGKNTTEALKGIEEVLHGASFAIEGMKSVQESINEMAGFDWWTDNEYSDMTKSQQTVVGGQLNVMNKGLYNSASTQEEADYIKRILSEAVQLDSVAGIDESAFQSKISEAITSGKLNESTKGQMQGLMRLPETWDDEIDIAKAWQESAMKMAKEAEKQRKEQEEQTHSFENANRLNREFNAEVKIRGKVFSDTMSLEKKIQENVRQESDIRGKMLKDLGSISEAEFLRRQSQKDIADLEADYLRKMKTIREGQITAQVKIMKDLMKQGQDAEQVKKMIDSANPMKFLEDKIEEIKGAGTLSEGGKAAQAFSAIVPSLDENMVEGDPLNYLYLQTAIVRVADQFDLFGEESKDAFKEFVGALRPLVGSAATQDIRQAILDLHKETAQSLVHAKEMNKADKESLRVKNLDTLMASGTLAGAILKRDLMKKSVEIFGALVDTEMGILENAKIARVNSFNALSMFYGNPAAGQAEVIKGSTDRSKAAVDAAKAATRSVSEKELYDKFNKGSGASTMSPLESDEYQNMLQPILTDRQKVGTDLSKELFTAKRNAELQQLSKEELERAVQRNEIDQKKAESELLDARYKLQAMDEDEAILKTARARRANEEITLATELKNGLIEQQVRNENKKQLETIQKLTELKEEQVALAATENILIKARISQSGLGAQVARQRLESQANLGLDTRSAIMSAGQTGRSEDALSAAQKIQEYNRAAGKATEATDHLRVRMAELAVSEDMLATELIDVGIEGVKSGWQQVFKTIADGSKDADEAWKDFGLGIIKSILDKITEKNIEKIVANLTYAFTGVGGPKDIEKQRSGVVEDTKKMDPILKALQAKNAEAVKKELAKIKEANDEVIAKLKPMGHTVGEYTSMLGIMKDLSRTALGEVNTELRGFAKTIAESTGYWAAAVKEFTIKAQDAARDDIFQATNMEFDPKDKTKQNQLKNQLKLAGGRPGGFGGESWDDVYSAAETGEAGASEVAAKKAKVKPKTLDQLREELTDTHLDQQTAAKEQVDAVRAVKSYEYQRSGRSIFDSKAGEGAAQFKMPEGDADKLFGLMTTLEQFNSYNERGSFTGIKGRDWTRGGGSKTYRPMDQVVRNPIESMWGFMPGVEGGGMAGKNTSNSDTLAYRNFANRRESAEKKLNRMDPKKQPEEYKKLSLELRKLTAMEKKAAEGMKASDEEGKRLRAAVRAATEEEHQLGEQVGGLREEINLLRITLDGDSTASGNFLGGKIQKFNTGGFVNGPPGIDQVPAMLTKGEYVVPRERVQKLFLGTDDNGINDPNTDNRLYQGLQGVTRAAVTYAVTKAMSDKKPGEPPTFNKSRLQSINIGSDISLTRGDPRMSGKFLAQDPVLDDYRGHLMELAQYRVDKKNAKYQEKLSLLTSIYNAVTSTGLAGITEMLMIPINKGISAVKGYGAKKWGQAKDWWYDAPDEHVTLWNSKDWNNSGDAVTSTLKRASGGPIPAMLTAGESYIPAPIAKRIGYNNLNHMNKTGQMPIIQGPGGIDNVGPMGLNEGDFIIRKSSTDKLLNNNPNMMRFAMQNPDGFKRGDQGYYEGGMVGGSELTMPASSLSPQRGSSSGMGSLTSESNQETSRGGTPQGSTETTNNISINVSIDGSGAENATEEGGEGSYERERDLSLKIKGAVLDVIREEKRIGGELS